MVLFTLATSTHHVVCQRFTRSISQVSTGSAQGLSATSRRCFQSVSVTRLKHLASRFTALVAKRFIYQSLDKLILMAPTSELVFLMFSSNTSPMLSSCHLKFTSMSPRFSASIFMEREEARFSMSPKAQSNTLKTHSSKWKRKSSLPTLRKRTP